MANGIRWPGGARGVTPGSGISRAWISDSGSVSSTGAQVEGVAGNSKVTAAAAHFSNRGEAGSLAPLSW